MLFFSGECEKRQLAIALREELPGFMVPRKIKNLNSSQKLPNGKYDMKNWRKCKMRDTIMEILEDLRPDVDFEKRQSLLMTKS